MSRGRLSLFVFAAAVSLVTVVVWTSAIIRAQGPSPAGAGQGGIAWRSDLNAARQEAAQSGRNLLIHFWAPWCGPCRRLETTVFNQPAVAATLEQGFIPVKLNADDFRSVATAFGVDRLPTDVIVRPDGAVLAKMTSPQNPSAYVTQVAAFTPAGRPMGFREEQLASADGGPSGQMQTAYANLKAPHAETVPFPARPGMAGPMGTTVPPGYRDPLNAANGTFAGSVPSGGVSPQPSAVPHVPPRYGNDPSGGYGDRYGTFAASQPSGAFQHPPLGGSPAQTAAIAPADRQFSQPPIGAHAERSAMMAQNGAAGGITPDAITPVGEATGPRVGLEGFCPVTLKRDQRWVAGDKRFGVIHRGCLYLFAGPQEQQQFWADPDQFSPVLSGVDPVLALDNGATVDGRREHGVEYNGWIYLFSSESTLQHFSRNPERYAGGVRQAMQAGSGTTFR